ncbi:MAG: methionyl-tRNA formyltransferase [Steroidobacteraceae bacterium]
MPPLRIVFAGTPEFSVPALQALHDAGHALVAVYTQPDRPAGRGRALAASAVKQRALALGLAVEQPATLKTAEAQAGLAAYAPDLMVVVAYGLILPQAVLDIPRLGCLNIHGSLLPRWRGAAPIHRAILAGDERTGISIMKMDAGLDTGPELLRRELLIGPHESAGELHDRLAPLGAQAIVDAVRGWAAGTLPAKPQPASGATYAAKIRKEEARIDWSNSAVAIDRQVRAFNPWPVAETRLGDEQVRIWEARPAQQAESVADAGPPGTIVRAADGRLLVATGAGLLELLTLQFPGRKPLKARAVLNSRPLRGERFGEVIP